MLAMSVAIELLIAFVVVPLVWAGIMLLLARFFGILDRDDHWQ